MTGQERMWPYFLSHETVIYRNENVSNTRDHNIALMKIAICQAVLAENSTLLIVILGNTVNIVIFLNTNKQGD